MATPTTPSIPVTQSEYADLLAKVNAVYESQSIILAKLIQIENALKQPQTQATGVVKVASKTPIADMLPKKTIKAAAKPAVTEKKEKTPVDIDDGILRIITDYTEKAMVIHGETASKAIKDNILKPVGFTFNKAFRYGAGWMLPLSKRDEFMRKLAQYNKAYKDDPIVFEEVTSADMDALANAEKAEVEEDLMTPAVPVKAKSTSAVPTKAKKTPSPAPVEEDVETIQPVARTLKKKPVTPAAASKRPKEESEEETEN